MLQESDAKLKASVHYITCFAHDVEKLFFRVLLSHLLLILQMVWDIYYVYGVCCLFFKMQRMHWERSSTIETLPER